MSLTASLHIATSALLAHQKRMSVTSRNIANAQTPFATRHEMGLTAVEYGGRGQGVRTTDLSRVTDNYLFSEVTDTTSREHALSTKSSYLNGIGSLLSGPGGTGSIAELTQELEDAFSELAASPNNRSAQGEVVSTAEKLAYGFTTASSVLDRTAADLGRDISATVDELNQQLSALEDLNRQARGRNIPELDDKRDQIIVSISEKIDVNLQRGADGSVTLFTKSGTRLNGVLSADSLGGVTGGRLGGLLEVRDQILPQYRSQVDGVAETTALRFEEQGLSLFTGAGASGIAVNPIVAGDVRLVRDGTHAVPGFTPNPAGGPEGFTGLTTRITAFTFGQERSPGEQHPGGRTLGQVASDFLTDVARGQAANQGKLDIASTQKASALDAYTEKTGIDVDLEMTEMLAHQRAYQAAAKVVEVNNSMWDALKNMV